MSLLGSRTEKQLSFWRHEPEGRRPQQDQKKNPKKNGKIPLKKTRPVDVAFGLTLIWPAIAWLPTTRTWLRSRRRFISDPVGRLKQ